MNEAEHCHRISLMHAGEVLITDTPEQIIQQSQQDNLESAFIYYLQQVSDSHATTQLTEIQQQPVEQQRGFSLRRLLSISHRETLELVRDPIRLA